MDVELAKDDRRHSRTAKSCGPDAPMAGVKFLGSKLLESDGDKQALVSPGRARNKPSTIAQGRPDCLR